MLKRFMIFADGACKGNPGPGGWGCLVVDLDARSIIEKGAREEQTTNNRMELKAAIEGLSALAFYEGPRVDCGVYCDSKYVLQGITEWIHNWRARGWRTSQNKPVLNQDLWMELDLIHNNISKKIKLDWVYVPGHKDVWGNNKVDKIASDFAFGLLPTLYQGPVDPYESFLNQGLK